MKDAEQDMRLVRRFQRSIGKEQKKAFSILYRRHEENIRRYLIKLTRDPDLAGDLSQETFTKALEGLDEFKGDSKFTTWLFQIATNTWRNYIKKAKPVSGVPDQVEDANTQNPENSVEEQEKMERVSDALDTLSEKLRAAFVLVRFEGMKYREAATTLDIELSALKLRVHRATKKLREQLESSGLYGEDT